MTAPIIETVVPEVYTPVPQRTQGQTEFDNNADAFYASLPGLATGINAASAEINEASSFVNLKAAEVDADAIATASDRVQTGLDRTQTGLDRVATAADRVQTGLDRTQTGLDKAATAADRVQTGLDTATTAADRLQTGLDRTAAATSANNAANSAVTANLNKIAAAQSSLLAYSFAQESLQNANEAAKNFNFSNVGIEFVGFFTVDFQGQEYVVPFFKQQPALFSFALDFVGNSYKADFAPAFDLQAPETLAMNFTNDTYQLDDGVTA